METDAPDALPKSKLDSLFLVEGDASIPEELRLQGGNSASNSSSLSDSSDAARAALPKEMLNHPANIHNVR